MLKVSVRLLIVSHVLVRSHNGRYYVQGAFGRHVDAFARRFDEVWLLSCAESVSGPLDEYHLRAPNVTVIPVPDIQHPVRVIRYALRLRGMLSAALRFPSAVKRCDVIHLRLPSPIGAVGALAAKLARKPTFVYVAGDREEMLLVKGPLIRPLASAAQKILRFLVDGNLCFTTGHALACKFEGPSDRVIPVASTAMDREHIFESSKALEHAERPPKEILFVGSVGKAKGVDVLLQAVWDLRSQGIDARLRIIGRTHDGGVWLRRYINSLGLQEAVVYHDHMPWDAVIYEYDKSDIFVLPSRGEGVPHVVIEAMSRGLPVIASNVGGIPWVVQHGESGLLVRPGSSAEVAQALLALFNDVGLRRRLVRGGLEVARRHILDDLIDGMVEKVCQYYNLSLSADAKGTNW